MANFLRVDRYGVRYRVPEGASPALPSRLTGIVERDVPNGLAGELARLNRGQTGVWLIRTLRTRAVVNGEWSASQIACEIGRQVAKELQKTLDAGPDGEEVLWYPNRAAYLGRFLADCAEGRAFGNWQYAEFDKWRSMAHSAALREAIVAEPENARDALANVLPGELTMILRQLSSQDSEIVLEAIADHAAPEANSLEQVLQAFRVLFATGLPGERRQLALALYLQAIRQRRQGRVSAQVVRDVSSLIACFQGLRAHEVARVAALLTDGDFQGVVRDFGMTVFAAVGSLAGWRKEHREKLIEAVAPAFKGSAATPPRAAERLETRLGGALLLASLLDEFPWPTDGWPDLEETPAANVLRFLTVVAALGKPRNGAAFADPLLRVACGVPESLDVRRISEWARSVPRSKVAEFRADWIASLVARRAVAGQRIHLVKVTRKYLSVDEARGIWLGLESTVAKARGYAPDAVFTEHGAWGGVLQSPGLPQDDGIESVKGHPEGAPATEGPLPSSQGDRISTNTEYQPAQATESQPYKSGPPALGDPILKRANEPPERGRPVRIPSKGRPVPPNSARSPKSTKPGEGRGQGEGDSGPSTSKSPFDNPSPEESKRLEATKAELDYATLDRRFELPPALARMLALNGQSLVREFAWRMPGFSRSSLPYVFENFLNYAATADFEEDRNVVRVDNPPLHLVLSMTGMNRKTFRLPATGDRSWVLTQRH